MRERKLLIAQSPKAVDRRLGGAISGPVSSAKPSAAAMRLIQLVVRDLARKDVGVAVVRRPK